MKFYNLNFASLIIRFYLLMAVVVVAFFANIPWLAFLALPIFFSSMMGIQFNQPGRKQAAKSEPAKTALHTHAPAAH